jgi:hypothetical protein
MTDPDEGPTQEDAFYASMFAAIGRISFFAAVAVPALVVSWFVKGGASILFVAAIWLGEATVYAAVRRRHGHGVSIRVWIFAIVATGVLAGMALWMLSTTLH